eukprot:CAMPEP_0118871238 /NCGR_PEP_ID=MMETSP1163-20130328/13907_1 /TAXON_ID=124430 /ORGANISM="Phaeomonas parva, Strain CCMP2877" /LENGTH=102 /DNA_ID=CAMNT_0006806327 /DNA_START=71 /DNA_END=377 /DNA_ORIENTATION=-
MKIPPTAGRRDRSAGGAPSNQRPPPRFFFAPLHRRASGTAVHAAPSDPAYRIAALRLPLPGQSHGEAMPRQPMRAPLAAEAHRTRKPLSQQHGGARSPTPNT